ncbi:MAG: DUF5054 domain-containing protein [Treponema sp.]|jgi:hypothetical protein|nr:DUF5054 domain-containing protein [Treponema sp.]
MSIGPKLVRVVFKTHLDIGFTDLAARVTENYLRVFIPRAIGTAAELRRRGGGERLVWTTGSWLIHTALKRSGPKDGDALLRAIEAGDIVWHALPFTSHTELMDPGLFEYGLSLSADLDRRFGKTTPAAKMTDVPGHTIGMVPLLAKAGVEYLHIGVNDASHLPETPRVFRWRAPDGSEVIVQYDRSYGDTLLLPGAEEALVIVNSSDNTGPPRTESVLQTFADLSARFPGAEIRASTLNDFVPVLRKAAADLPVLTEEIGDTWIHGVATDPAKVARFRELLRLRKTWEAEGRLSPAGPAYGNFYGRLIMVSEHTWGLDLKKHLGDFKNWQAEHFKAARQTDTVPPWAVPEEYGAISRHVAAELEALYPGKAESGDRRSYSFFESSHREQRAYLDTALEALSPGMREEAAAAFKNLEPCRTIDRGEAVYPGQPFALGPWQAVIGDSGAIISLRGERELAGPGGIGAYSYQTFSYEDFVRYHQDYNRDMDINAPWVLPDFGKPGMQYARPRPINAFYRAHIRSISRPQGREDLAELRLLASPQDPRGAPGELVIRYHAAGWPPGRQDPAPPRLEISLDWFDKEASRLPEALWFGINLNAATPARWRFRKLGVPVNPLDVVKGGNRSYHAVAEAEYRGADGRYLVTPLDSPLAALGKPKMLRFDDRFEDPAGGLYFNIFNNIWGTNFPMWLEGEGRSRFVIEF